MIYVIILPTPITTVPASTVASQPDYSGANLILMTVYVAATLALVIITIWQAKASLAASARQSQAAINAVHQQIEASELQSQIAIDAVHEQIEASKLQSQDANNAIHEQIKASEKQSQETMYNQFKPVIVPLNRPISVSNTDIKFTMEMVNKGAGVALKMPSRMLCKGGAGNTKAGRE